MLVKENAGDVATGKRPSHRETERPETPRHPPLRPASRYRGHPRPRARLLLAGPVAQVRPHLPDREVRLITEAALDSPVPA